MFGNTERHNRGSGLARDSLRRPGELVRSRPGIGDGDATDNSARNGNRGRGLRGRRTRLVTRQRYSYPHSRSALWHMVGPVDFIMERRMLRGIKARAEGQLVQA